MTAKSVPIEPLIDMEVLKSDIQSGKIDKAATTLLHVNDDEKTRILDELESEGIDVRRVRDKVFASELGKRRRPYGTGGRKSRKGKKGGKGKGKKTAKATRRR